jgi:hypothetical protein
LPSGSQIFVGDSHANSPKHANNSSRQPSSRILSRHVGRRHPLLGARRLFYNLVLAAVVIIWLTASWPHFRPAFNLTALLLLVILGLIANACYCAAYLIDIPLQQSSLAARWKHRRWTLWWIGTLFAVLLANYWIADEIYPFVQ